MFESGEPFADARKLPSEVKGARRRWYMLVNELLAPSPDLFVPLHGAQLDTMDPWLGRHVSMALGFRPEPVASSEGGHATKPVR